MAVSSDPEHRFDLALQLGDLKIAYNIAKETDHEQKWKQLADLAITRCDFDLAQEALHKANDLGGLLLLATSAGLLFYVNPLIVFSLMYYIYFL